MKTTDPIHNNEPGEYENPPLNLPASLSTALVPNLPPSAHYIPTFITPAEEILLLHHINNAPLPIWKTLSHRRLQAYPSTLSDTNALLAAPLPCWLAEPIISRILSLPTGGIRSRKDAAHSKGEREVRESRTMGQDNIFSGSPHGRPNHCLVNEYLPGQGIYPHEDGSAYWPVVCTVSLGSHTVLDISPKRSANDSPVIQNGKQRKWRVLQERRSLLISTDEVYTGYLHGIEGVEADEDLGPEEIVNWDLLGDKGAFWGETKERGKRISLTFRDVLKVKTLGKAFGGLKR